MKKIVFYIVAAIGITACNDAAELYNYPENKIGFVFKNKESRIFTKSFVHDKAAVIRDTVYLPMRTMGFVPAEDRPISVEQVDITNADVPGALNAIPGVHYVSFDDPDWKKLAVVKGGKAEMGLPIILLRDASLQNNEIALKVRIVENDVFKITNPLLAERIVVFSDQLLQPAKWDKDFVRYFGVYGPVKHRFMLDNTTELWDDDFIDYIMYDDNSYMSNLMRRLQDKLSDENTRRASAGLGPLRETSVVPGVEGLLVKFPVIL